MMQRRRFLAVGLATAATLASPTVLAKSTDTRRLRLVSLHTGERFAGPYWSQGGYLPDALSDINQVLRDHRSGEVAVMDTRLLDLANRLFVGLRGEDPYRIVSGYRSPKTNAMLLDQGRGVAKKSFHMRGMALDLSLPHRKLSLLRDTATSLKQGGVGYYGKSGFVHIDVGPVRYW